ncbi:MAG: ABC transporter substrate-binding protein [Chloroflexota bacterium]
MGPNRPQRQTLAAVVIFTLGVTALAGSILLAGDDPAQNADLTPVTLFMSYIPSVQFAPVYVADARGYFAEEGIDVTFEHSLNEADGIDRLAVNDLQFGLASGEQVLLARANGRPLVYVFAWYHRFPVGVAAPVDSGIALPQDLAGRVVGIPALYGASYVGLRALLDAAGLSEADLGELRAIGYTAPENLCAGQIDAAVVYVVNEPIAIADQCTPVNVIEVSDYATLVANGLLTNEQTIRDHPDLVTGMVRALRRGLENTLADPDAAFTLSVEGYVQDLPAEQYAVQREVLLNSIELWRSDELGMTDPAAWEATQRILIDAGLMAAPLDDLSAAYEMRFVRQAS